MQIWGSHCLNIPATYSVAETLDPIQDLQLQFPFAEHCVLQVSRFGERFIPIVSTVATYLASPSVSSIVDLL